MNNIVTRRRMALLAGSVGGAILFLTVLLLLATSGRDAQAAERPNVVLIIVDSVRKDHVSAYGYERPTTPHFDALAADGALFTDASSTAPWTYPANAAMLTGRAPGRLGVDWHRATTRIPASETMLAEYLHDAGYRTAGFINTFYVYGRFGFRDGFDHYEEVKLPGLIEEGSQVNNAVAGWLDDNWQPPGDQPLFLYVYYRDPHTPYTAPAPFGLMYDKTYTGTLTGEVYGHGREVVAGSVVPTERDVEHLLAIYDGEITYWDSLLNELLTDLQARGLMENTILAITSDHGEMFGEHGLWTHNNALFEEVLRVPLLISWPGVVSPTQVISAPVSTMDMTPTLLKLLGIPWTVAMDGRSLVPLLQGQAAPPGRAIYAEQKGVTAADNPNYWIAPRYDQYAMKQSDWKYIHQVGNEAADALYRVDAGSLYEPANLIAEEPEKAAELYSALDNWFRLPDFFNYIPQVMSAVPASP